MFYYTLSQSVTLTLVSTKLATGIKAFEFWVYRKNITHLMNRKRQKWVLLRRIGTEPQLMFQMKWRKLEYFGHVMCNDKYYLFQSIIEGKIWGKRTAFKPEMASEEEEIQTLLLYFLWDVVNATDAIKKICNMYRECQRWISTCLIAIETDALWLW